MIEILLFGYLPYAALVAFGVGTGWRLRRDAAIHRLPFTPLKPASEGALVIGAAIVIAGQLLGLAAPSLLVRLAATPWRLALVESVGIVGAMLFCYGAAGLWWARVAALRTGEASQWGSVIALSLLLVVAASGVYVSLTLRWVTAWYAELIVPYLRSLLVLRPSLATLLRCPAPIRAHVLFVCAFLCSWPLANLPVGALVPWRSVMRQLSFLVVRGPGPVR